MRYSAVQRMQADNVRISAPPPSSRAPSAPAAPPPPPPPSSGGRPAPAAPPPPPPSARETFPNDASATALADFSHSAARPSGNAPPLPRMSVYCLSALIAADIVSRIQLRRRCPLAVQHHVSMQLALRGLPLTIVTYSSAARSAFGSCSCTSCASRTWSRRFSAYPSA